MTYCKKFNADDVTVSSGNEEIKVIKFAGEPPEVEFSVILRNNFKVDAYRRKRKIAVRDIIDGFSNCVSKYSQIEAIISRLNSTSVDMCSEMQFIGNQILVVSTKEEDVQKRRQLVFLGKQVLSLDTRPHGRRYSPECMTETINLYLRSQNSYRALSELLVLPTRNTIFDYFGKLGQAGSLDECVKTVKKVFESLNEGQRKSFISFDEIHIKPG